MQKRDRRNFKKISDSKSRKSFFFVFIRSRFRVSWRLYFFVFHSFYETTTKAMTKFNIDSDDDDDG